MFSFLSDYCYVIVMCIFFSFCSSANNHNHIFQPYDPVNLSSVPSLKSVQWSQLSQCLHLLRFINLLIFQHRLVVVRRELTSPLLAQLRWKEHTTAPPSCFLTGSLSAYFHPAALPARHFHASAVLAEIVQFNLSDIGEGIKEVTVKVRKLTNRYWPVG